MSTRAQSALAAARAEVREISVEQARALQASGGLLIDVRESGESAAGMPADALALPRGFLELRIESLVPDPDRELALLCGGGARSLLAARALQAMGYRRVASVSGGFEAWRRAGLPEQQVDVLDAEAERRYARQLRLPQVGRSGQRQLAAATVLLVGAGGLGSPAALYLAAAGVGRLRIVDADVVEESNLQRQVLHDIHWLGLAKVDSALARLRALNPRVVVEPRRMRAEADTIDALLEGVDVVIDGSDSVATRYLVNDACVRHGKALVYGAVHRFEGQLAVFPGRGPCYRCLFPLGAEGIEPPNCAEVGVLGVVPGVLGLLQANEALKLILGIGRPLASELLRVDLLDMQFRRSSFVQDPDCPACAGR